MPPSIARRGLGRPRHGRTAIAVCNAIWKVIEIVGDVQSGGGRFLEVQTETWLVEEHLSALRGAIATYRS